MFIHSPHIYLFFFFNDTATTEIYTLSLHDALPISALWGDPAIVVSRTVSSRVYITSLAIDESNIPATRSEEHTSELQSQSNLVCRLLLEKKKHREERTSIGVSLPFVAGRWL